MVYPNAHTKGSGPFFSVVMPTREKAHLLQNALRSALSQTFDDYEIIVCDNLSTDGTEEVVRELADERVRYFRTEERLSMPDNWELAFEHARGDHVTYLCDDDAMNPDLLKRLHEVLAGTSHVSVGWKAGGYYHPDWPEKEARCTLFLADRPTTGKVLELSSSSLLERMFALESIDPRHPRLNNSCSPRVFLEQRKRRIGRLFSPTCPDFSVAVATLAGTDRVLFIDEYLMIYGLASASNGSFGFPEANAIETFMKEFSDLEKIWRIPLTSNTSYNHIAVTLIGMKDILSEELAPYSLSITNLFIREHEQIELLRSRGADVSRIVENWNKALAAQSVELQRAVRKATTPTSAGYITRRLRTTARERFPAMARGRHFLRTWLKERGVPAKGPTMYRFDNIFEAARALGKLP